MGNGLLALVNLLPTLVDIGYPAARGLIEAVTGKVLPTTAVETYAVAALKQLPALINAGQDITKVVTETQAAIERMITEGRGPTDEEWAAQMARIAALEGQWNAAR